MSTIDEFESLRAALVRSEESERRLRAELAAANKRCAKLRERVKELEDEWPLEILRISSYEKRRL